LLQQLTHVYVNFQISVNEPTLSAAFLLPLSVLTMVMCSF